MNKITLKKDSHWQLITIVYLFGFAIFLTTVILLDKYGFLNEIQSDEERLIVMSLAAVLIGLVFLMIFQRSNTIKLEKIMEKLEKNEHIQQGN